MSFLAAILASIGPWAIRAVIALGFSTVSLVGITAITNQLVQLAQDNWSAMPVAVIQLATLSGIPQVMGMLFGAFAARMAVFYAAGLKRFVLKG